MKTTRIQNVIVVALRLALTLSVASVWAQNKPTLQDTRDTRIGKIELDRGCLSRAAVTKLYDELNFQRACQAYMWGLPIVSFAEWQQSVAKSFGAGNLDYVRYLTVRDKLGILTPNATTHYIIAFPNLAETGPQQLSEGRSSLKEIPRGRKPRGTAELTLSEATRWAVPAMMAGTAQEDLPHRSSSTVGSLDGFFVARLVTYSGEEPSS